MRHKLIIAAVMLCAWSGSGAQSNESRFEITPFGAYRFGGTFNVEGESGSYKFQDSPGYGILFNFPHRSNTKWEILYSRQSTEAEFSGVTVNDPVVDVELQVLQLGGIYLFESQYQKVAPYLSATIGATHAEANSSGSESDTYWSASVGLGMLISPTSRVGLRLEARAYGTFMNSSTDLFCSTSPDQNVCAIRLEGDLFTQIETFAGVVVRF